MQTFHPQLNEEKDF